MKIKAYGNLKSFLAALVICIAFPAHPALAATQIVEVQVSSGGDDAEEDNGSVSLTSSDLELTVDHGINQTVGIRFNNVNVPSDAIISSAYIQFTVDEASSTATNLTIQGEASGNAAAFNTTDGNISSRPPTSAFAAWSPAAWPTPGIAGTEQRTADLSAVIQEIINHSDWLSGNSMVLLVTGDGFGKRVAESYNGDPAGAPVLYIEYGATPGNLAPVVSAGADRQLISPIDTTCLAGTASDDGIPGGGFSINWAQQSGPGTIVFDNSTTLSTTAVLPATGIYSVALQVGDGELTGTDNLQIAVSRRIDVPGDASTIQAAVDLANDGDIVIVAPGLYQENVDISDKTITLASRYYLSGDPADIAATVIDGGGGEFVVSFGSSVGPASTIMGFHIRNGVDGVIAFAPVNILYNRVTNTFDGLEFKTSSGGLARGNILELNDDDGIDLNRDTNLIAEQNIIRDNKGDGIEMRMNDYTGPMLEVIIRDNIIINNEDDGIQLIDYDGYTPRIIYIERNIIAGNLLAGVGIMGGGNTHEDFEGASALEAVFITNNTFIGNDHGVTGGDNLIAQNNIFIDHTNIAVKNIDGGSSVAHNLFWNNGIDIENSNVDLATTVLLDPALDINYHPQSGSAAIDAGTDVGFPFNGLAPDLGAFETPVNAAPVVDAGADLSIQWSTDALVLGGSASDDGLPELPGQLSVAWTQITGACGVVFADASQAITTATFPVPGTYTLQLVADDGIATSADERTIELSAEPIENRPPVAIDDTGNTNEESTVTLAVAANDTDPDSNLNSASTNTNCATCTLPDNGTLVNNGNGSIDYTPTSGFVGDDSFVYEICDTELLCDTATATITVTGTSNTLPAVAITAPVDGATVTEGTVLTFTGTASDAEDGDITGALSWSSSLDGPLSGSGGSVMATLSVGTHTITASVTDAGGLSGSAAITVMVSLQGNNAPVVTITAPADGSSVTEGTVVTFTGMASDVEDSGLTTGISWSSSLDGPLQGSGGSVMATLSAGTHSITASVTDSGGLPGSDAITVDVFPDGGLQQTLDIRVAAGADDAEEISSGRTSLTSSDLELVFDREDQTVGLRFNGIAIPPGALITEAYIQFTVDEVDSEATSLTIEGEASSNAAPFTKTVFDISSRARTVANAAWVPAPWTAVGEADTAQRTTDLSGIVSQIINAQGWASGNSLAFIISGSGKRVAESFNGDAANAPLLHVSFFNSGGNAFPSLNITAPTDGTVVSEGTELTFSASASDIEDGDVSASTTWTSSLDGALPGSGSGITATLSVGTHVITANAVDSTGQPASDMISVIVTPAGGTLQTLDIQINTGADDAEEKATGSVSLSSSDLELIFDKTDQTVGLRFSNVTIEPGAVIVDAWVQFTVDEASSGGTELLLQGEASPDAQGFTNSTNNISSRPRTNAQVDWSPVPWQTVGVAGPDQRTPNLAGIISEIINGGGWSSGNALALVVTGSGERVAESANGQPGGAPILHINYVSSGTN